MPIETIVSQSVSQPVSRNSLKTFLLFVLFLLFIDPNAFAVLTILQNNFGDNGNAATNNNKLVVGYLQATGSGNLMVIGIMNDVGLSVTGVSDGTNNFKQFPNANGDDTTNGTTFETDVWYLPQTTSGKNTFTVTYSGNSTHFQSAEFWEVSGFTNPVVDTAAVVNSGTSNASQNDIGAAVTTSSTKGFVVGEVITQGNVSGGDPLAGNEFTSGGLADDGGNGYVSLISTTAASHQPQWGDNNASNLFTSSTAAFKEASGGGLFVRGGLTVQGRLTVKAN